MAQLLEFAAQETAQGQMSLPLDLSAGDEVLLTSIFLHIANANVKVALLASVGWQAQLEADAVAPEVIFRIRRGGLTPGSALIFQTSDSVWLDAGHLVPALTADLTTSLHCAAPPDTPAIARTIQQYALTAQLTGSGAAAISGPVTLAGRVTG
jgi:hypothetical protein